MRDFSLLAHISIINREMLQSFLGQYFGQIPDPRVEHTRAHQLLDIIAITLFAVLSGANSWVAIDNLSDSGNTGVFPRPAEALSRVAKFGRGAVPVLPLESGHRRNPLFPQFATDARTFARYICAHWGVENQLPWCLDVIFKEDASRIRKDHAPRNIRVLRRLALNLLRQELSKGSLAMKRYRAGLDDQFVPQILSANIPQPDPHPQPDF